jgi:hypothetical protein
MLKKVPYEWREILDIEDEMSIRIFNSYGPFALLLYKRLINLCLYDQELSDLRIFDTL